MAGAGQHRFVTRPAEDKMQIHMQHTCTAAKVKDLTQQVSTAEEDQDGGVELLHVRAELRRFPSCNSAAESPVGVQPATLAAACSLQPRHWLTVAALKARQGTA